ncbi:MAG: type II toxin-antitoxin system VapC family toxin [Pseudomonadota bacterium]|jgi:predicted nucleic acid-binding protein|uniref:Membrane-associated protein containing RNA-binding TRAM domain and ribonuclease PIN-domain n=1 Tax=Caballeronia sordidicola TaxID=196367 RepID=A0A242MTN8_CABSO|nr:MULTISPECIES: type II toxin-antitoxin system VapC family toxin [Burkholderiaceae]AME25461.1 twitching motility protein PilT [Burkholderia sp. PAMC 26561]MDP9157572.1 type II toxin-antitoxin system VapC family toxin [Pseudomonadota bacterium]OTP74743.1 Membrane-associated protein containing RNA-binding TRAM domain and ribonuclease PIN-domain [Caballeronia sordidicola]
MVNALFDTCILIDYLNRIDAAKTEMTRYESKAISLITWMEIMVGAAPDSEEKLRAWLNTFRVIAIDEKIAARAVELRQKHRVKLPDAIVWASAQAHSLLLVSRNTKDFSPDQPGVRVPYAL